MTKKLKLTFCGGVGTVTGANFLLENETTKILVDCGMEQGGERAHAFNRSEFPFNPAEVDILLITHAHLDHIGRIPKLVKDGFHGIIYSTPETRKITVLMLEDSVRLLAQEAEREKLDPLYSELDVRTTMSLWRDIPYHTDFDLGDGFSVVPKESGHILGAAMYEISYNNKKIAFTGDLGNTPTPLLNDTEKIDADYLVMESVYGDRNHESNDERREKFKDAIFQTISNKSTLMIPSFSLEKTQILLYELNNFFANKEVPIVPVYLDSPLAIKVTKIYHDMSKDFNSKARAQISTGDDIFDFPKLTLVGSSDESKALKEVPGPKIIIAGSGMSNGGRILHHEINYLPESKNIILFSGYQSVGTLGREIQNGSKNVHIYGQPVRVKAKVMTISGYSSHKDSDHLVEFVGEALPRLKKVFVVMGEPKSSLFLVQRLRDYLNVDATHPEEGETVELDF